MSYVRQTNRDVFGNPPLVTPLEPNGNGKRFHRVGCRYLRLLLLAKAASEQNTVSSIRPYCCIHQCCIKPGRLPESGVSFPAVSDALAKVSGPTTLHTTHKLLQNQESHDRSDA